MCESDVYRERNGKRELIMKDASIIKVLGDKIKAYKLLGDSMEIQGRVKELNLLKHYVLIE